MTRKDYINIAAAIQATQARIEGDFDRQMRSNEAKAKFSIWNALDKDCKSQLRGVRRAAAHLADFLKDDNPRFDQARFLNACGYGAD